MIAFANPSCSAILPVSANGTDGPIAWHERFLQMLPSIVRHARLRFRHLSPEAREEAIAEVVALTFAAYARLVELGREEIAYATPLSRYAVAQYRAGRRVGMKLNVRDVLSDSCRKRNGHTIERLDQFDRTSGMWKEVLVEDRRFGPADAAASRIDFRAWLKSLTKRNRQVAEKLAVGESTSAVARLFGVSRSRVSQMRRELQFAWEGFQAEMVAAV